MAGIRPACLAAQAYDPRSDYAATGRRLFLFLDWFHVQKGDLLVSLDPQQISPEGRKLLEMYKRDFGKEFDQGGHGYRRSNIPFGIRIRPEVAQKSEPWLRSTEPWEKSVSSANVIHDEGRYRCWYIAHLKAANPGMIFSEGRGVEVSGSALAYCESADGWNWNKPALDVLSYGGSTKNNLVSPYSNGGMIFRDDHGPAEERYKGFQFAELPKAEIPSGAPAKDRYGLYGIASPDGYHWKLHEKPLIRYFSDTNNIANWDPVLKKYVGYFRHHMAGRTISRAETDDFWNWPEPLPLLYADPMDAPADDYYTNGYTTYPDDPSLRLLFASIYHRDTDLVDVRMGVSRNGRVFQWVSYHPAITPGMNGAWSGGSIYANPSLLRLPNGDLALPLDAYNHTHNEVWFHYFYKNYESRSAIGWAIWKDSRLAGIEAEHIGEFTTNAAPFNGTQIEINARTTRAGSIEVELREQGKPIEGFSFADCNVVSGDHPWVPCRWKGKETLAVLRGKKLETGFRLRSAKVFGYRYV